MTRAASPHRVPPRAQTGFSLVELLVSVAIGLVLTLILTTMIARQEGSRRTLTSGNDLSANSAYLSYILDREIRSAGSGFTEGWGRIDPITLKPLPSKIVGCTLNATRSAAQILPRAAAFPDPFSALPTAPILAPLLIHAGAGTGGSDVLAVAAGASGLAEAALAVRNTAAAQVRLNNTIGLRNGDLMLLAEVDFSNPPISRCLLQQVTAVGLTQDVTLGGLYNAAAAVATYGTRPTVAAPIGNIAGNTPRFQFFGVGANNTLVSYDLLNVTSNTVQPIAEGVVEMRAQYGLADPNTGQFTGWVAPAGAFAAAALSNGDQAAQDRLRTIIAVRVGLILRSDLVERQAVNATTVTLFGGTFTYNVPPGQEGQRFRAVEFTVPLRNVIATYP